MNAISCPPIVFAEGDCDDYLGTGVQVPCRVSLEEQSANLT